MYVRLRDSVLLCIDSDLYVDRTVTVYLCPVSTHCYDRSVLPLGWDCPGTSGVAHHELTVVVHVDVEVDSDLLRSRPSLPPEGLYEGRLGNESGLSWDETRVIVEITIVQVLVPFVKGSILWLSPTGTLVY